MITTGVAGTTAPNPDTSETWTVEALPAAFSELAVGEELRLVSPTKTAAVAGREGGHRAGLAFRIVGGMSAPAEVAGLL
jgi:hypothetical protein